MNCPNCGQHEGMWRDEVDIGVGTQYGPWHCDSCGWYEGHEADMLSDELQKQERIFTHCNVCGKKIDMPEEDKMGMCVSCSNATYGL